MKIPEALRKPGRPRAIPDQLELSVIDLYFQGNGYRSISRILENEHGVSSHYTTVKRVLKRLGVLDKQDKNKINKNEGV